MHLSLFSIYYIWYYKSEPPRNNLSKLAELTCECLMKEMCYKDEMLQLMLDPPVAGVVERVAVLASCFGMST
jgi:hypothetical protein